MSEKRYGVHDCPNGFYYLRDVTDHSVYIHRNYGYLYSPYKEDIELVSILLNELADKVDEQQTTINEQSEQHMSRLNELIDENSELRMKIVEQQDTISALKDIFKDIITYSEWDSKKPYCSLGISVDKKTYYKIREILNE